MFYHINSPYDSQHSVFINIDLREGHTGKKECHKIGPEGTLKTNSLHF